MACEFSVEFHASQGGLGTEVAIAALDIVERLEGQLSVYREQSEIVQINAAASQRPVVAEAGLFGLLVLAQQLGAETDGAFDFTSGPLSKVWGFFRRSGGVPNDQEIAAAMSCVGCQYVVLDPLRRTVQFTRKGIEIHCNSFGKGYALDKASETILLAGLGDYLIQGGSSSVLARGVQRGAGVDGWRIGVPHPLAPDRRLGEIVLHNAALGTSGAGTQFFLENGKRYGHLIDPRSGRPAESTLMATAVAPMAAAADALATAFYVMGPDAVAEYCRRHPEHGAIVVCPGGEGLELDVHVFNLSKRQWMADSEMLPL